MGPNGYHVFAVFLACALITWGGGYLEVWQKDGWKNLGTLAVILGLAGLLGIFMDSTRRFSELQLDFMKTAYGSKGEIIKDSAQFKRSYFCETQFVKSDMSPPDFDINVRDQHRLCEWFKGVEDLVSKHPFDEFVQLKPVIPSYPQLEGNGWNYELQEFENSVRQQEDSTSQLRSLSDASKVHGFDYFYYWFAPFAVGAALGIQLGKSRYS